MPFRIRASVLLLAALLAAGPAWAGEIIRFGLTGAVVRENLQLYDRLADYVGAKLGRPVQFVQRRSYRETMEMLQSGELEFSWVCSYVYVSQREPQTVELMAVPKYQGQPLYHSYIIVHQDSPYTYIGELEGRVFAYVDPESNTGYLVPRAMLTALGRNPDRFFRHSFFTYSHSEIIQAVAEHVADAGAVDSYVWDYLTHFRPEVTAQTKVIQRSPAFGFPPLVARAGGDPVLRRRMTGVFLDMAADPQGRRLLDELRLDGFVAAPDSLYDGVRALAFGQGLAPRSP